MGEGAGTFEREVLEALLRCSGRRWAPRSGAEAGPAPVVRASALGGSDGPHMGCWPREEEGGKRSEIRDER